MTIDRVKPGDWSLGEKLTSAQQNALDLNVTYAADRRGGESDLIGALWQFQNAGRAVVTSVVGADADSDYGVEDAAVIVVDGTVTADRTYTLLDAGAVEGDSITIFALESFTNEITVQDEALNTLFTIGANERSDGEWVEFRRTGIYWRPFRRTSARGRVEEFLSTASTPWTSDVDGWHKGWGFGGGGGGGAGFTHSVSTTGFFNGGGGGGGGALAHMFPIRLVKGRNYVVNCGSGGPGGAASGVAGTDGGDTQFFDDFDSVYLAILRGAQGGQGGAGSSTSSVARYMYGGQPVRGSIRGPALSFDPSVVPPFIQMPAGSGGFGRTRNTVLLTSTGVYNGSINPLAHNGLVANTGGACGGDGTDSGSYIAGGAGGGGAAGPEGDGGNGGNGGNGNNAGVSVAGGNGVSALANTGAGGGGAGASGHGSGGQGGTGTAGTGGSGKFVILKVK